MSPVEREDIPEGTHIIKPAMKDPILKKLDSVEIREVLDYVKAVNKSGLLSTIRDYSPEKDKLEKGDVVMLGYDDKDREIISKGGSVSTSYSKFIYKEVRIVKIDETRDSKAKILVELAMNNELNEDNIKSDSPFRVWISPENVFLIIED